MSPGRVVVFGGWNIGGILNDTGELLPAPVATWTRHGAGCPGSAGVRALAGAQALELDAAAPGGLGSITNAGILRVL